MGRSKPVRPPTPAERKTARLDNTPPHDNPRVYDLIQLWVHDRMPFHDACKAAGIKVNNARAILRDPKVRAKYRAELDVLRENERVPSIHKLAQLRDTAKSERIQLEAARLLAAEHDSESARVAISVNVVPGYVIDLSGDANQARVGRVPEAEREQVPAISTTYDVLAPDVRSGDEPEEGA